MTAEISWEFKVKGLDRVPQNEDLMNAYNRLQSTNDISAEAIGLWSQWSRFDPRLAELLLTYLKKNWQKISPVELNYFLKLQAWPTAIGVLCEHLKNNFEKDSNYSLYLKWMSCVMDQIAPAPFEQFFIGQRSFAGIEMRKDAQLAISFYRRWGYLGRDLLWNKAEVKPFQTLLGKSSRVAILHRYLKTNNRITVNLYCELCSFFISRRQAERDLSAHPFLLLFKNKK